MKRSERKYQRAYTKVEDLLMTLYMAFMKGVSHNVLNFYITHINKFCLANENFDPEFAQEFLLVILNTVGSNEINIS